MADVKRKLGKKRRWGAAAVELAIVTPILLTMLFGIIEYGWLFTVRQALTTASREGARTAALPGSTVEEVLQRVEDYTEPLGLSTCTADVTCDDDGNPVGTVTVSIPYADVTLVGCYFGEVVGNITASASMRKESVD
jgi:Flp pilus assembly protein TadG